MSLKLIFISLTDCYDTNIDIFETKIYIIETKYINLLP